MARGASRVPFCGQKSRGHLKKSRFCARAHLEALSRPHIVIWPGWFYNSKLDLQHSCIGRFMQRFFNSFWALFWFLVHFTPPPSYHIWLYVQVSWLSPVHLGIIYGRGGEGGSKHGPPLVPLFSSPFLLARNQPPPFRINPTRLGS
jgi:hypothetical protein